MITSNSSFTVTAHLGFDSFFCYSLSSKTPLLQSYPFRLQRDSCERCRVGKFSVATHGHYTSPLKKMNTALPGTTYCDLYAAFASVISCAPCISPPRALPLEEDARDLRVRLVGLLQQLRELFWTEPCQTPSRNGSAGEAPREPRLWSGEVGAELKKPAPP
jgi:hypothetical protein